MINPLTSVNKNNLEENIQIKTENLSFIYESTYNNANREIEAIENDEEKKNKILEKLKVLKKINLNIEKGKFIALCGNTGCGKSTLVRTFNGLIPHFYSGMFFGIVNVFYKDTVDEKISDLSKHVGLVFQNPENQLVAMTVEREIAFGLENQGIDPKIIKKKITEILNFLQIEHLRKRHPYELSGGEQQRVAIASILTLEPDIIILDEPTSALDPKAATNVIKLLKKINLEKKITIIIIEHRLDMIIPYTDEIILMKDGEMIQHDSVEEILNNDLIYEIGVEVPEYINIFHNLKKSNLFDGPIPRNIDEAAHTLNKIIGGFSK
ncbi:MAG: ABC transporter ATP-binding protein [archaeon]|nr:ABC transporter ATP-binding protein [archaeon]